jgi:holin-like protein
LQYKPLSDLLKMMTGVAILLACQIGGDWVSGWLDLPLPGPVLGMALLTVALAIGGGTPQGLNQVATWLLRAMPLFFIPAGVGIILLSETLRSAWLPISAALLVSTMVALAATVVVMDRLARVLSRGKRVW